MAAKLTRLTHKMEIQLNLVTESSTIFSSRSRRSVWKLLDTPSYDNVLTVRLLQVLVLNFDICGNTQDACWTVQSKCNVPGLCHKDGCQFFRMCSYVRLFACNNNPFCMNVFDYCQYLHPDVRECIQNFPDWPPGARTANGTAFCQWVQLYRYFVSQSSEFCRHNPLCCFSTSVYCCLFRYRPSPETFGHTLELM
jgi:hypothetical protein